MQWCARVVSLALVAQDQMPPWWSENRCRPSDVPPCSWTGSGWSAAS